MGACKSRFQKKFGATEKMETPLITSQEQKGQVNFKLRPDAQPYVPAKIVVPEDEPEVKESWEIFLDAKKKDLAARTRGQLRRNRDGNYTTEYRNLLVKPVQPWRRAQSPTRENFDIRGAWRSAQAQKRAASPVKQPDKEVSAKKRKPTALKKAILAQRVDPEANELWQKFDAHLQKMSAEKTTGPELVTTKEKVQDDISATSGLVPYGLSDRCYLSDAEDKSKAHRHRAESHALVREYVDMQLTPELEQSVTDTLFTLRRLRMQDLGMGQKSRRYAVGFREVARLITQKQVQCLIVAPDVEKTGGALEDKIASLVMACEAQEVPVVFALSRRQLGAAIQKNVTVSVLAIQEVRGCVAEFTRMIEEATEARAAIQ